MNDANETKLDERFSCMSLAELEELWRKLVAAGPSKDKTDRDFGKDLANEIARRKKSQETPA